MDFSTTEKSSVSICLGQYKPICSWNCLKADFDISLSIVSEEFPGSPNLSDIYATIGIAGSLLPITPSIFSFFAIERTES